MIMFLLDIGVGVLVQSTKLLFRVVCQRVWILILFDVGNSTADLRQNPTSSPRADSDVSRTPSKPAEPYFIVPPGFHSNTFFVGMDKELKQLHRTVIPTDPRKREKGTACALLHGPAVCQPNCDSPSYSNSCGRESAKHI